MTKTVRLQTEYMGARKVILHGVALYISEEGLGFFFSQFEKVALSKSKGGIATGEFEVMINVINVLYIVVEGRRLH